MKDLPYFKWYPADAESDEAYSLMTNAEVGFYHRCLNRSWINDGLPSDLGKLARILRLPYKQVEKLWSTVGPCFYLEDGRYRNQRQEEERIGARGKSQGASRSAANGVEESPGFIYLIRRKGDAAVKIGSTKKVSLRLAQLRYRYRSEQLSLIESIAVTNMRQAELTLHQRFESVRLNGEWFLLSPEDITLAITLMGDIDIHPSSRALTRADSDSDSDSDSSVVSEKENLEGNGKMPLRTPITDPQWFEFIDTWRRYGWAQASVEDWRDAEQFGWSPLDSGQRLDATAGLSFDLIGKDNTLPANYLRKRKWTRGVRSATEAKRTTREQSNIDAVNLYLGGQR